jgi:hypothetical protein
MHRQQVHDALRDTHEEKLIVDGFRALGLLLLTLRVMQEDEIQIRGIPELHPAELAVARPRRCCTARRCAPGPAQRRAKLRAHLLPAKLASRARR